MNKLEFDIEIKAPAKKVWQVLWDDVTYRQWTSAFHEGSYAVSDWNEGSKVHFLASDGGGMFSTIVEKRNYEYMAFKHLGEIKNFEEQVETPETKSWSGAMETYLLKEENEITFLKISVDIDPEFQEYFTKTFPKAIELVKKLSEKPILITIETMVNAPVEKVWQNFTSPAHITKWNNASDDWHTPSAENDLRVGGKFTYRMEAKDGSFGFDFWGIYNEVTPNEYIGYTMGDGRIAKIYFSIEGSKTKIVETFEAETENSIALQKGGWQATLDNFKKYTELNAQ